MFLNSNHVITKSKCLRCLEVVWRTKAAENTFIKTPAYTSVFHSYGLMGCGDSQSASKKRHTYKNNHFTSGSWFMCLLHVLHLGTDHPSGNKVRQWNLQKRSLMVFFRATGCRWCINPGENKERKLRNWAEHPPNSSNKSQQCDLNSTVGESEENIGCFSCSDIDRAAEVKCFHLDFQTLAGRH